MRRSTPYPLPTRQRTPMLTCVKRTALAVRVLTYLVLPALVLLAAPTWGQEVEESFPDDYCLDCHDDPDLEAEDGGSLFADAAVLGRSVHDGTSCIGCHDRPDADFEDVPHYPAGYEPVACISCHRHTGTIWQEYFHRMLSESGSRDIPDCKDCHGGHDARLHMGMKFVCERCHEDVAAEYRQSYHFKKYQEDTRRYPICTTCHDPHFKSKREVMSEIEYKQEIVDICSRCHQKDIETYIYSEHFHKLRDGNTKAPVCTSCHEKHAIKKPSEPESRVSPLHISEVCNDCHPGHVESLHRTPDTDPALISCASCHTGHQTNMVSINQAIFKEGGIFNRCNFCHSAERHAKENLAHGEMMLIDASGAEANCTHCHVYHFDQPDRDSEHARTQHTECVNCHALENREYNRSVHGRDHARGVEGAPSCTDCHGDRDVKKAADQFTPEGIIELCSRCHTDRDLMLSFQVNPYVVEGYKDTYHGKLFEMATTEVKFAVCTNCHGVHTILAHDDPASSVHRSHIVETCRQCHPKANDRFVSYLVHPKAPSKAELAANGNGDGTSAGPAETQRWAGFNNFVTAAMTMLLVGTLAVFGFHTLLWFQRGIKSRLRPDVQYYRRVDGFHRFLHVLVNLSFLTLAFTGLPQSYAHTDLAKWLFTHVMTLKTAQQLHYAAAVVTGLYFVLHLIFLALRLRQRGWRELLTGPRTMMFRKKDWEDFRAHTRWFFRRGPAPRFDRWTYWEKFDYFAVFWGVLVIGLSGVLRWKEDFFGNLLGGGFLTLADTIHKDEALLATAFIFIIHFFNTHLRAEKFPMDISIYTGRVSEEEFRHERPLEWERHASDGSLEALKIRPLRTVGVVVAYLWGMLTLLTGLFLLVLIVIGQFAG